MNTATEGQQPSFTVVSFLPRPSGSSVNLPVFQPHSIKRHEDGEVFTIGDRVSNRTKMVGKITEFSFLNDEVFVETTWSGVGMNLDSLIKVPVLPSPFQCGDEVRIMFDRLHITKGLVTKVHFVNEKVQYDLHVDLGSGGYTRIYNVDGTIVEPFE